MTVKKTLNGNTATIVIEGWLDTTSAPELDAELADIEKEAEELVMDFSRLEYISSAGLRQVVSAYKKMGGNMVIKNASGSIKSVFSVTGLDKRIRFEEGEEQN